MERVEQEKLETLMLLVGLLVLKNKLETPTFLQFISVIRKALMELLPCKLLQAFLIQ